MVEAPILGFLRILKAELRCDSARHVVELHILCSMRNVDWCTVTVCKLLVPPWESEHPTKGSAILSMSEIPLDAALCDFAKCSLIMTYTNVHAPDAY